MPNTLAALPSSQYATLFELVSGKLRELELELLFTEASDAMDAMDASGPTVALLLSAWVDFHRTDFRTEGVVRRVAGRDDELRHGRHTKRRRVSRGAAVRSWGKAWKTDAIAMAIGGFESGDGGCGVESGWADICGTFCWALHGAGPLHFGAA
jgi:hypothetical protein